MVTETHRLVERWRRRFATLLLALVIASAGYILYRHHWLREWSGRLEAATATSLDHFRKTFYLRVDKGFDQAQPVEIEIPFEIIRVEWRSRSGTTFINITLSNNISSEVKRDAAYEFQIWLNDHEQVVWLGHHLYPKEVDEVVPQPLVLDGTKHQVLCQGQVVERGNQLLITLPISTRKVDAAQLYYIPSREALRQAGGFPVMVSSLVHQRPPWGYRIRRLSVQWCDKCTYEFSR
ncbi:MAG: hypothetical protein N2045_09195 [Fimbriimonadales bacterium]|jgi:hypothetical protein|nr:hypothetical protein [Armatimonadota bacterium]MCX7688131.1 hypothetical protein [Fimbriimonadales bacterium]CUU01067.1 hypothetical protein GBSOP10_100511 [Armatimonadetes bacterium GBS]CUU34325.1 hypothetical protein GXSOP10_11435 [Armatimonadetes bacterium GXS]CUU36794.1 hypothetical protein DCOP10_1192 [Armatimonadetes bacterium DC]GBC91230.1 hypothetical protein HRbin14_01989 [bacterium HR14]